MKTKIAALAVVFVLAIASAQAGDPEKEQVIKTIELAPHSMGYHRP